jgi:hypothetical protein
LALSNHQRRSLKVNFSCCGLVWGGGPAPRGKLPLPTTQKAPENHPPKISILRKIAALELLRNQ